MPEALYHDEWERRKLRNRVHLTIGGCLGPCALANVAMLLFDGRSTFFHGMDTEERALALYDYIEAMLAADAYLPPPPALAEQNFTGFTWEGRPDGLPVQDARRPGPKIAPAPAGFLFLTHADTDLLALSTVTARLPEDFPPVRAYNLMALKTDADVNAYLDAALPAAEVVIVRLHGGRASFAHGIDRLLADARARGTWLVILPATDQLDPELTALSTVGVPVAHELYAYLQYGGPANYEQALRFLADHLLTAGHGYDAPAPQPRHGVYHPDVPEGTVAAWQAQRADPTRPVAGLLFYRSHLLSGNTDFVDALVRAGDRAGLDVLPVYAYSLKEGDGGQETGAGGRGDAPGTVDAAAVLTTAQTQRGESSAEDAAPSPAPGPQLPAPLAYFVGDDGRPFVDVLITTMSFAMGGVNPHGPTMSGWGVEVLEGLDVPVVQAITAGSSRASWEASARGLSPVDAAMNIVLPEFDGRIHSVPVSFKGVNPTPSPSPARRGELDSSPSTARAPQLVNSNSPLSLQGRGVGGVGFTGDGGLGTPVVRYVADEERCDALMRQAARMVALRRTPNADKRIAVVLTNSTARISRIGNAVGLDAPASLMRLFDALRAQGYTVEGVPETGDELIHALIARCSYDTEFLTEKQLAGAAARVSEGDYGEWFDGLPEKNRREMTAKWGAAPGEAYVHDGHIALAGLEFGNVFVALQPPRGYGMDPNAIYHMPDLPPTHNYHALYRWLRDGWGADAIVHAGKHGTLEWLPGKAAGPSATCYPDQFLGDLPLVYPFIINDPGEGAQAKRRTHAVIVDHMTPPMTSAGAYDELAELAQLVDEYYQVEMLDPAKLPLVQRQIWDVIERAHLDSDIHTLLNRNRNPADEHPWDPSVTEDGTPVTLSEMRAKDFAHLVQEIDGYLCELAGAQIRDGLHILGHTPEGEQLIDLIAALVRVPNLDVPGLRNALGGLFEVDVDALLGEPGGRVGESGQRSATDHGSPSPPSPLSHEGRGGARFGKLARLSGITLNVNGDVIAALDDVGRQLVAALAARDFDRSAIGAVVKDVLSRQPTSNPTVTPPSPLVGEGGRGGEGPAPKHERWPITPALHIRMSVVARTIRRSPTRGEAILWQSLRRHGLDGTKFRRQQPIGPFVVDFYAPAHRLVVEVDGGIHETQVDADRHRQELIESLNIRFVRIPTELVERDLPAALVRVRAALAANPVVQKTSNTDQDDSHNTTHAVTPPLPLWERGLGGEGNVRSTLTFICDTLLPALRRTDEEIAGVLRALDGRYVPAGPSGAPTRGMAHVLPTGRNFYAVDPRALPSVAAWRIGTQLADDLLARHLADEGRYPESVGLSIWGTSAMRTHGDDIAQVFALLGVRPRWQGENRRLVGIDVMSLQELGRPRIDVVCRISGFFRDAFPYLIQTLDEAVRTVALRDEPVEQNFVRKRYLEARERLQAEGLEEEAAHERALYRVFGSKPGSYGAGILPLIDEGNWDSTADFAEAYVAWGGYAYTGAEYGVDARSEFQGALAGVEVAAKNQDNREHDIFDSDDYLQYHGGMIATIRALTGRAPRRYFGDSSNPERARIRDLKEEALRVFRTRVVNPKWIASIQRHGYKGGLELAATVDYLFGYDATSDVMDGWMYGRVSEAYVLDAEMQEFLKRSNPWALRDMAARLLEASDRGLWQDAPEETLDALRGAMLDIEGDIEERG